MRADAPVAGQHDFGCRGAARRQFGREPNPATVRRQARLDAGGAGGGGKAPLNLQRRQPDHPIRGRGVGTVGAKCADGARCAVFQKAQPVRPEDANKLNELINPLEAATNALSAGAAWAVILDKPCLIVY